MMDISVTQDSITRLQKLKDMLTGVSFGSANYETAYSELQDWIRYTTPGKDIDKALLRLEELYQRDKDNFTSSDSKSSFQSHLMEIVLADLEKKQASLKAYQDRTVSKDQSSLHSVLSGNHPGVTIHDNSVYLNGKDTYEGYDELLYLYLQTFGGESLRDVSGGILRILIMTGNRYATFHCTLDNFGIWSELLNILDEDSEAINSLLLKCYVHQIRVATIKWVIDRAELLKYRLWEGIAQCLATTFETTQNINYIEYV